MLQGKIVMRSANEQSKSAGVFPYLELDNGELVKIRKVKDNPFENDNLKQYQDKFVVLQGEYNENNTFMVTEIAEVIVDNNCVETETLLEENIPKEIIPEDCDEKEEQENQE